MSTIKATFRNGRIEPDEPLDLPDGTELQITLPEDDDESLDQTEIDRVLAAMDQIIPFDMSPEEETRLEADRQARKEWEKAQFLERAEKLRKMWE
jgi:predicted DNA-binding antitoxin AbrB/MazE fold protein